MSTSKEQHRQNLMMYGCTIEQLEEQISKELFDHDPAMYAICILSDVQEMLNSGTNMVGNVTIRQYVNRAKYYIGKCVKSG